MKRNTTHVSICLIVLLIVLYVAYQCFFSQYITLENVKVHGAYLYDVASRYYIISVLAYMAIYFVLVASSLPAVAPLTMLGGFLFGTFWAVLYSTVAATAGAVVAFLFFRSASKATVAKRYQVHLAKFSRGLDEYGAFYLLIIHFMLVVPFFVINALAALANVSLWRFIWTTAVGFLPCAIVYAFAGKQLMLIRSVGDVFSWKIIVAILLLIGIVLLPLLFKRIRKFLRE